MTALAICPPPEEMLAVLRQQQPDLVKIGFTTRDVAQALERAEFPGVTSDQIRGRLGDLARDGKVVRAGTTVQGRQTMTRWVAVA